MSNTNKKCGFDFGNSPLLRRLGLIGFWMNKINVFERTFCVDIWKFPSIEEIGVRISEHR